MGAGDNAERVALADAGAARLRATFLADASDLLGASFDYGANLGAVAELAASAFVAGCHIVLHDRARGTDVRAGDGAALIELLPPSLCAEVTATRSGRVVTVGDRSALVVPIVARPSEAFGTITLVARPSEAFSTDDLSTAEQLGRRAGVASDNALLYHDARDAIRTREQILAIVSHDLRNPMSAIAASAFALSRVSDPRVRSNAETIKRAAKRMSRMINDLLDLAMIAEGKLSIRLEAHAVDAVVAETLEPFVADADARGVRLSTEVASGLPPIQCDADRIVQVLTNLIANALKVTPAGGVVAVRALRCEHEVLFEVEDTGPGISERELPQLFERFYRGISTEYRGAGLGLSIAKALVEAHGGRIGAESTVSVGSRFYFALPLITDALSTSTVHEHDARR